MHKYMCAYIVAEGLYPYVAMKSTQYPRTDEGDRLQGQLPSGASQNGVERGAQAPGAKAIHSPYSSPYELPCQGCQKSLNGIRVP